MSTDSAILMLPMHDPQGVFLTKMRPQIGLIKRLFGRCFMSVSPPTAAAQAAALAALAADDFFRLNFNPAGSQGGDHFVNGMRAAAAAARPAQMVHICMIDRLLFALQATYWADFAAALAAANELNRPVLFQRTAAAWQTHPRNYQEIEGLGITLGRHLYGRYLDFGWCQIAVPAGRLLDCVPRFTYHDFGIFAELVLMLVDELSTVDVDWLAWEDPFILDCDAAALKAEREQDPAETAKRLAYMKSILAVLLAQIP